MQMWVFLLSKHLCSPLIYTVACKKNEIYKKRKERRSSYQWVHFQPQFETEAWENLEVIKQITEKNSDNLRGTSERPGNFQSAMDRVTSCVKTFHDRETRQVLLYASKVLAKTLSQSFLLNIPLLNLEVAYYRRSTLNFDVLFAYFSLQAPPPSYETRITTSKLLIELENYEVSFFKLSSSFSMISFKWKSYQVTLVTK